MKKLIVILSLLPLISGCWDEEQYKDVTIVPLMGLESGESEGGVKSTYAFPIFQNGEIKFAQSEGEGLSTRDSRNDANQRSMEGLDMAHLEVLLISDELAKKELYMYLDMYYRTPRNRISSYIAVVEGEMPNYFQPTGQMESEVSIFFSELLRTGVLYTYTPNTTLQKAANLLFDDQMDLSLPFISIEEGSGIPKLQGAAMFSKRQFTGKTLTTKESIIANLMRKEKRKYTRITYRWKDGDKEYPITFDVDRIKRKWKITNEKIKADYTLEVTIEEFPHDKLYKKNMVDKIEKFLSKEVTKDFQDVIQKTKDAKSDIIGFGRHVHAFEPKLWEKGDWQETYSTLPIEMKVKVKANRVGILE